jgi:hypothetical protein
MNRDHLLGCRQYIPDVENGEVTPYRAPLVSVRQEKEFDAWLEAPDRDPKLTAFEKGDWQPPVDGVYKVLPPNLTVSGGMSLLFSNVQRPDAEWDAVWNRVMKECVDAMTLASPRWVIDPTHVESVADLLPPYRVWSVAKAEPKAPEIVGFDPARGEDLSALVSWDPNTCCFHVAHGEPEPKNMTATEVSLKQQAAEARMRRLRKPW